MLVGSGVGVVGVPGVPGIPGIHVNIQSPQGTSTEDPYWTSLSVDRQSTILPQPLTHIPLDGGSSHIFPYGYETMSPSFQEDNSAWNTDYSAMSVTNSVVTNNLSLPLRTIPGQAPFLCSCGGLPRTSPMTGPPVVQHTYDGSLESISHDETLQQHTALPTARATSPWTHRNPWPVPEVVNYTSPYADSNAISTSPSSTSTTAPAYAAMYGPT